MENNGGKTMDKVEKKWNEMELNARDAVEDFRDFAEELAIVWAGNEIRRLRDDLQSVKKELAECQSR